MNEYKKRKADSLLFNLLVYENKSKFFDKRNANRNWKESTFKTMGAMDKNVNDNLRSKFPCIKGIKGT